MNFLVFIHVKKCDPLRLASYAFLYTTQKTSEIINVCQIVDLCYIVNL